MICEGQNQDHQMRKGQEYIDALEEERRKIQVFQRELPLCLELVTQAIEASKQQLSGTTTEYFHGDQSESSEQISSEGPVLEEFMPIKKAASSDNDDEQQSHESENNNNKDYKTNEQSMKPDWLRSAQLWNQTLDPPTNQNSPRKVPVMEVKRNGGGAFHPFRKDKPPPCTLPTTVSSTEESGDCSGSAGGGGKKEEKGQPQRKPRRCWSPELHRRFLNALGQIGGSRVATPKQIRELMKVDGLTNDEVKSHLQKYRLHARRPSLSVPNGNPQAPQFVVVGGIWVPPPDYTAMAAIATAAAGEPSQLAPPIYAPVAAPPPPAIPRTPTLTQKQNHKRSEELNSDEGSNHSDGVAHCRSPATSSSSPAL
ncbi:transcription factor HHO3-like isoform X1 [Diospyros lotus]|uniref:transcription factor HHO3-like isoform X1 n=1 Tax=Diospyros lotus TaxID=55363 RepID=UPI00224F9286|nr:transcription factor HHO3-like isoform X1 [Diospyros lotus]XP_052198526.1 transcription factor HHO3-like isoform X1 [Diospyros lotus]